MHLTREPPGWNVDLREVDGQRVRGVAADPLLPTATDTNETVLWFQVNPLHNLVHILVGGALLAGAAGGERGARAMTMLVAVTYTVVGIVGFWATGADWNVLALNTADNWLHLGTAALGFLTVMASSSQRVTTPAGSSRVGGERPA